MENTNDHAILGTLPDFVRIVIFGVTALVPLDLRVAGAVDLAMEVRDAGGPDPPDSPRFFLL